MRTRANGQPLSVLGVIEDARRLNDDASPWELSKDIRELLARERRAAFDEGFQLAAKVEHRATVEAVATMVLAVLGKDAADGWVDVGALGTWVADSSGGPASLNTEPRTHATMMRHATLYPPE